MLQTIFDTAARNDLWVVPGCFFCGCKSIFSSVFVQNTPKNMGGGTKASYRMKIALCCGNVIL